MKVRSERQRQRNAMRRLIHLLKVVNDYRQKSGEPPLTLAILPLKKIKP